MVKKIIRWTITITVIVLGVKLCREYLNDSMQKESIRQSATKELRSKYPTSYTLVTSDSRIDVSRHPRVYTVTSVSTDEVKLECRESSQGFLLQEASSFYGWKTFNPKTLTGKWHAEDSAGNKQEGTILLCNNSNGGYDIQVNYTWIETKDTAYDNTPGCTKYVPPYKGRLKPNW